MGLRINTNMGAIQAQTSMTKVTRETHESLVKLSSGQRINKAADDAAGLAISEKLKSEIRSSRQAGRNANDGLSLVQTAEGGLNESSGLLTRMRELAMQSASDTIGDVERKMVEGEFQNAKSELERISRVTEFNGTKLLNGSSHQLDFHVGVGGFSNDDQISYNSKGLNAGVGSLGVDSLSIVSKLGAQNSLGSIDSAIDRLTGHRSYLGSIQNRLTSSSNNLQVYNENMSHANSRIRDLDFAVETATQARNSILGSANAAVLAQANTSGQTALKLL